MIRNWGEGPEKMREGVLLCVCDLVRRHWKADQETQLALLKGRAGGVWLSAVLFCCLFGILFTHCTFKGSGESELHCEGDRACACACACVCVGGPER